MRSSIDLTKLTKEQLLVLAAKVCVCQIHKEEPLVCPICFTSKGGKALVKKYGPEQMKKWGKLGGRPKKMVKTQKLIEQIAALEKELKRRRKKS